MKTTVKRVYEMEMSGEEFDLIAGTLRRAIGDKVFDLVRSKRGTFATNERQIEIAEKFLALAIKSYETFTGEVYDIGAETDRVEAIFDRSASRKRAERGFC